MSECGRSHPPPHLLRGEGVSGEGKGVELVEWGFYALSASQAMSKEFETLDQPLMVEIIRRRQLPPVRFLSEPNVDAINSEFIYVKCMYVAR